MLTQCYLAVNAGFYIAQSSFVLRLILSVLFALVASVSGIAQVELALVRHTGQVLTVGPSVVDEGARSAAPMSFEQDLGFLLVKASVDGMIGTYVLDSGAPGLILNGLPERSCAEALVPTGDAAAVGCTQARSLTFGPLHQKDVSAYIMDLSHISERVGTSVSGILGHQQLRSLRLQIDYSQGVIRFPTATTHFRDAVSLRVRWHGHLPTFKAKVEGRRARLAFDTGAQVNALDARLHRQLASSAKLPAAGAIAIRGLNAEVIEVPHQRCRLVEVDRGNWHNLDFAVADLSSFRESGKRLDGLLGSTWVQARTVTLDYPNDRIYLQ